MKQTVMFCIGTAFQVVMIITFFLSQTQASSFRNLLQIKQNGTFSNSSNHTFEVQK